MEACCLAEFAEELRVSPCPAESPDDAAASRSLAAPSSLLVHLLLLDMALLTVPGRGISGVNLSGHPTPSNLNGARKADGSDSSALLEISK